MNFNKEQIDFIKNASDHVNVLCGGRGYRKTHQLIKEMEDKINKLEKENQQLKHNRDKALKIIDSYELGKYDYSIPAGGIIELREALKGDSDE